MKILLIGSGGREHALAHTFVRQGHQVHCLLGNPGIEEICLSLPERFRAIKADQVGKLSDLASDLGVDLTVVGPEDPLSRGIVDLFKERRLPIFGPSQKAAQLESSKAFAKAFMAKHQVATARFFVCRNSREAYFAVDQFFDDKSGAVIKPSGLTAGKGVTVCPTKGEAYEAIKSIMEDKLYREAGSEVVVEELLYGNEVSVLAFCDGDKMIPMIPAQDHKRVFDGDQGPNTGGMGAYAPAPFANLDIQRQIYEELISPTLKGLKAEGIPYQGVLYFGVMMTLQGPKLLEYNCRFGDPETQALLPLLDGDLAEIMMACYAGHLDEGLIRWSPKSSCCVVMSSKGYPGEYETGFPIENLESVRNLKDVYVFQAGTKRANNGQILTAGGRVLGVTGVGHNLEEAINAAYQGVKRIRFEGAHYRTDIAKKAFLSIKES